MKVFRRGSILQRGLLLIALPVLFQVLFVAVLFKRESDLREAQRWAFHTKDVIAQAESAFRLLFEAQGSMRGYVLTQEPAFHNDFEQSVHALRDVLAKTAQLVADNPLQTARAKLVSDDSERLIARLRVTNEMVDAHDLSAARARVQTLAGKEQIGVIRKNLDRFLDEEAALDKKRVDQVHQRDVDENLLLSGGAILMVLVSTLAAAFFSRGIIGRLAILNENVRRLSGGESLAKPLSGDDEIARLDRTFHEMSANLAEARVKESEHRVALEKRAEELAATNLELKQKSEENEMFVYSVSHDLRSPLVNLQGFSRELTAASGELRQIFDAEEMPAACRTRGLDVLSNDVKQAVYFIETAVTRLASIIDALLRLSRAGRIEYRTEPLDLKAIIQRVLEAMRGTTNERNAKVTVDDLPPAFGDATAVEQIFANLIGNALNYLDPTRPGRVKIGALPPRDGLQTYFVEDNGLGIPEAYHAKVFVVFQRLHGKAAPGEGIGLALVRRMVERHGGKIWVESIEGAGSTFFVALPQA